MAFRPSPAKLPPARRDPPDPRFFEAFTPEPKRARLLLAGVPFDDAVIGRKGCRDGPTAIREAFRFLSTHDPDHGVDLAAFRIHDLGDVEVAAGDVLATHRRVRDALVPVMRDHDAPVVLLGGDNSLTYAHVNALHDVHGGPIGIVVLDAHYDLRPTPPDGVPTSGTPFRRILEELPGKPVRPHNLVEVGIRPYANSSALARYAEEQGVKVVTIGDVRDWGIKETLRFALENALAGGVQHLWLSVDIDGLDQAIAAGCSAPGAGGLWFHEAAEIVHAVAAHPKCRGMDLLEVAPNLDPSGNTARTAAQLVAAFAGGVASRGA